MANFKRRRPKNRRAGCLLCKPHKANGAKGSFKNQTVQEQKAILAERGEIDWSRKRKRPYSIEVRRLSPTGNPSRVWGGEWETHKRYHTEQVRDEALAILQRKVSLYKPTGTPQYEYRIGPTKS